MFEEFNICPYPGLRSFTEEESLYFKGREGQVEEVIQLLSKNRFLMVTGASGDGKSSLVYAGVIPNARAGFFKSQFNNWVIADFRPERNPLKNLAISLSNALEIDNIESVETEISRGYSALVDLYENSKLYSEDPEQSRGKANLMILVDQFEELFTNPENYSEGVPSNNSTTTLNLLLETAKISLEKNLPIYIICTMRSDFIGQCAAFRGLPEYIGFSQFFVPRLKRKEIQQIIEEPAELSGNKITRRLVERLIYDLTEGIDQLPILQHALSQIWIAADNGSEEMDLLHYAMVGGMPVEELPDGDQLKYHAWFKSIPETQQKSYDYSSLENVLDIHANKLYESAADHYNNLYEDTISVRDAKNVLAITFACLTKIDQSRTVRNRMTLAEITHILNREDIDVQKAGRIINIFRKEGNTFIRPFLMEGDEIDIPPNTVLDITHESLIRNWKRLLKWVNTEYRYYEDFIDFKKQLDNWVSSGKSRNFLLPIGPLSYFEEWYNECRPNKYWISRYIGNEEDNDISSSELILENTKEYLKKSNQKHIISRTFMKYGASKIAFVFAIIVSIFLSSYYYSDALKKQNDSILLTVQEKGNSYVNSNSNIPGIQRAKALFILSNLRLSPDAGIAMLEEVSDPKIKVEVPVDTYSTLIEFNHQFEGFEKIELIRICLENLEEANDDDETEKLFILRNINKFLSNLVFDEYYNPNKTLSQAKESGIDLLSKIIIEILSAPYQEQYGQVVELNTGIRLVTNFGTESQVRQLIKLISPFDENKTIFETYYPESGQQPNGRVPMTHREGYQILAEMYASLSETDLVAQSMDSILKYNPPRSYFWYQRLNNHITILSYFIKNNDADGFNIILNKSLSFGLNISDFYRDLFDAVGYMKLYYATNQGWSLRSHPGIINPIPYFIDPSSLDFVEEMFFKKIEEVPNQDFVNFRKAVYLKNKALIKYRFAKDRGEQPDKEGYYELLDEAFTYFDQTSEKYLQENTPILYHYYSDGFREVEVVRREEMLYPDLLAGWHSYRYSSPIMVQYLLDKDLLNKYYNNFESLDLFSDWVSIQFEKVLQAEDDLAAYFENYDQDFETLKRLESNLSNKSIQLDLNYLEAVLANHEFESGNSEEAISYVNKISIPQLGSSSNRLEYLNYNEFMNEIYRLCINLAPYDINKTSSMINTLGGPQYKTIGYLGIANETYGTRDPESAFIYLDSALNLMDTYNANNVRQGEVVYFELLKVLDQIGGSDFNSLSSEYVRQVYPFGLFSKAIGNIESRNYYQAYITIPNSFTPVEEMYLYSAMIYFEGLSANYDTRWKDMDQLITYLIFKTRLQYINT